MKNITFIAAFSLLFMTFFFSCKKNYTCECTVLGNNTSETWKNIKASEAKDSCNAAHNVAQSYGGSCSIK